jgi:acyl-CoA synthetase (AMP-forming)/AMP-acid ligase II
MIQTRIYNWAKVDPAKPALIWNSISLNYLSFSNMIEATRQQLERERPSTFGTVVVLGRNLLSVWINVIALRSLGFITVSADSLDQAVSLQLKDIVWVVTAVGEGFPEDDVAKGLNGSTSVFARVKHTRSLPPAPELDHLIAVAGDLSAQGGHILFTSGTTGRYKKVLMAGKNDDDINPTKLAGLVTIDENSVYYGGFFPLYTGAGYGLPLLVWNAGGCVVLEQPLTFENLFKLNTTFTMMIPFHLRALVNKLQRTKAYSRGHFALMTGGSFVPLELADRIRELLTDDLIIAYGSTECSAGMVMSSKYRSSEDLYWFTPAADRVVQVVNQYGEECAVGEEGDVRVLLKETDCHGYLDDPEEQRCDVSRRLLLPGRYGNPPSRR